jgi:peptidoglycan/xylan/chitin deacetylase (PgdA/CDA1 family)
MFHHFCDSVHPRGQGAIDAADFERLLHNVGLSRILPAREWTTRAVAGTLRDELCLTFDDNLRCQFDVAVPVMEALGVTAFFFVYTSVLQGAIEPLEVYRHFRTTRFESIDDFYNAFFDDLASGDEADDVRRALERFDPRAYLRGFDFYTDEDRRFRFVRDEVLGPTRYNTAMDAMIARSGVDVADLAAQLWMNDEQLQSLHRAGHVIGLHSHTHPTRIERLPRAAQFGEYSRNSQHLKQLLGEPPMAMSHPCNSYNITTLPILRELGVQIGFRANMQAGAFGMLELPREDHCNLMRSLARAA